MDFKELGDIFKQEREKRGLSIKEVMEVTKISRRNIIAIEDGDRSDLPHPVYTKGFIKSYARFLGLDGEEMARAFDCESSEVVEDPVETAQYDVCTSADRAFQEQERAANKKSKVPAIVIVLVLLALLGGLVYYFGFFKKAEQQSEADAPVAEALIEKKEEPAPTVETAQTEENVQQDEVASGAEAQKSEVQEAEAAEPTEAATVSEHHDKDAESVSRGEEETSAASEVEYAHVLVIRATAPEGCWVGVWKDDSQNMARDFFLRNGEPLRLMFNSYRRIRIGNVPGVTILYNGKDYTLDPAKGKTQDLRFGKS